MERIVKNKKKIILFIPLPSYVRLWINEIELSNVYTFKRPVLHPPTLELPFGKIEMEEL